MSPWRSLFLNEQFSDLTIKVKSVDGYMWRFPAHSLVLMNSSEWFRQVIDEQNLISTDDLTITFVDVSHKVVLSLLRYIYTTELQPLSSGDSLLDLLSISIRYKVWPLQMECETKLLQIIGAGNACHFLELATQQCISGYGSHAILETCRKIILDYGQIIFSSELLFDLNRENLEKILQSDYLNVVEEDTVIFGLWLWGKRKCCRAGLELTDQNVFDILDGLLQHVRFPSIKNRTKIPKIVLERCCKCLDKASKGICSCFKEEKQEKCRKEYRQPRDLIRQSSRFVLFDNFNPLYQVSDDDRLLCAQVSFNEDVFLMAAEIAGIIIHEKPFDVFLSVITEDTGVEVCREEVHWDNVINKKCGEKDYALSSLLRLSYPIPIPRKVIHSLHLILRARNSDEKFTFPAYSVHRRKNSLTTKEGPLTINIHTDRVVAINSIYFIVAAHHLEK